MYMVTSAPGLRWFVASGNYSYYLCIHLINNRFVDDALRSAGITQGAQALPIAGLSRRDSWMVEGREGGSEDGN